ncbi:MAG: hypothetical protein ACRCXZ_03120 [Patescibacteria group bacterium]
MQTPKGSGALPLSSNVFHDRSCTGVACGTGKVPITPKCLFFPKILLKQYFMFSPYSESR